MKEKLKAEIERIQIQIDKYKSYKGGDNFAGQIMGEICELHIDQLENLKRVVELMDQGLSTKADLF